MRQKLISTIVLLLWSMIAIGQTNKPELTIMDVNGRTIRLSDFRGKVVLVNFWATWCPPCRKEIPDLIQLQRKYRAAGLRVLGITYPPEKLSEVRRFAKTSKTNYPLALGTEKTKALFSASDVLPITVVIDRTGEVREVIEGILFPQEFDEKVKPLLSEPLSVHSIGSCFQVDLSLMVRVIEPLQRVLLSVTCGEFRRKQVWRTVQESNPCRRRERANQPFATFASLNTR
jgi:thiol-disulfide isomerase/thioredoxin